MEHRDDQAVIQWAASCATIQVSCRDGGATASGFVTLDKARKGGKCRVRSRGWSARAYQR